MTADQPTTAVHLKVDSASRDDPMAAIRRVLVLCDALVEGGARIRVSGDLYIRVQYDVTPEDDQLDGEGV